MSGPPRRFDPGDLALRSPLFDTDRPSRHKPKSVASERWEDEARFIKAWLENPLTTGAVSPSSRSLCKTMARYVDPSLTGPVVELGPGTGPVTDALIRRGIAPERLVLVEFDAAFCRLLARRYPGCHVVHGDAYGLGRTLQGLLQSPAAAVISSLPLLTKPEHLRLALLFDAFALMRPEAPFVQFTYGLTSPIPKPDGPFDRSFQAKGSAPVWLNLPPARVWVYRSQREREGLGDGEGGEAPDLMDKLKARGEKLTDDLRDRRKKLRTEFQLRSIEAREELKLRTLQVKLGLERHKARVLAERKAKPGVFRRADDRRHIR